MKTSYIEAILVTASAKVGWPAGGYTLARKLIDKCYKITIKTDPEPFAWLRVPPTCEFDYIYKNPTRY